MFIMSVNPVGMADCSSYLTLFKYRISKGASQMWSHTHPHVPKAKYKYTHTNFYYISYSLIFTNNKQ